MNRVNATDPVLVIVLILIGAAIAAVLLYGLWRRAHNPNRVEEYDERQRTARLLAYRAAFWTVMVFLGVSALVKAAVLDGGGLGGDNWLGLVGTEEIGLKLGLLVFWCVAIWKHAYQKLDRKPRWVIYGCAGLIAVGGANLWLELTDDGVSSIRVFDYTERMVFWLIILIVQLLRMWKDRQEERADRDA